MTIRKPTIPFRQMYYHTVDDYISQICKNTTNYAVLPDIDRKDIVEFIWYKYEEYKAHMLKTVTSGRLDRHKIAACLCGAIVATKPLVGRNGAKIAKNANELLALYSGLAVIKFFMIFQHVQSLSISENEKKAMGKYLQNNFDILFPDIEENICDTKEYENNIANALLWTHSDCDILKRECFRFEPWSYATIFYHVEALNKQKFKDACAKYEEENKNSVIN